MRRAGHTVSVYLSSYRASNIQCLLGRNHGRNSWQRLTQPSSFTVRGCGWYLVSTGWASGSLSLSWRKGLVVIVKGGSKNSKTGSEKTVQLPAHSLCTLEFAIHLAGCEETQADTWKGHIYLFPWPATANVPGCIALFSGHLPSSWGESLGSPNTLS